METMLVQCYEVLWIHNIDAICTFHFSIDETKIICFFRHKSKTAKEWPILLHSLYVLFEIFFLKTSSPSLESPLYQNRKLL